MKKVFPITLIIIGIILLLTPFITERIIKYYSKTISSQEITAEEIRKNIESRPRIEEDQEEIFDFASIRDADIVSAIKGSLDFDRDLVIGTLLIPDLDIDLPIFEGLTDANLMAGAATMRPDQIMGQGNYPISGHNMKNKDLLFGSLMDIEVGSKVITSDGYKIFEYEIYENIVVPDTAVEMIYDERAEEKASPIISLMTCYHSSRTGKRFFSLGKLVKEYPL